MCFISRGRHSAALQFTEVVCLLAIGLVARILQRHPQQLAKCANSVCARAYTSTHIHERGGERYKREERERASERADERESTSLYVGRG